MRSLGLDPTIIKVGNSYHIGVTVPDNNSTPSSGSGGSSVVAASFGTSANGVSSTVSPAVEAAITDFAVDLGQPLTHDAIAGAANVSAASSSDKLLLLDQALADIGAANSSSSSDASLVRSASSDIGADQSPELSDLALAAAFDNETDWRSAI
jgi:hypothetical protein